MVALPTPAPHASLMPAADRVPIELLVHVPGAPDGAATVRLTVETASGVRMGVAPTRCERVSPCEFHARFDVPRGSRVRFRITFAGRPVDDEAGAPLPTLEREVRADGGSLLFLSLDPGDVSHR